MILGRPLGTAGRTQSAPGSSAVQCSASKIFYKVSTVAILAQGTSLALASQQAFWAGKQCNGCACRGEKVQL